ncbi:SCO family protein [Mesobacillus jeotgali]|uniref:SCO family protein n=1 Tax=Mesobacillus jeotgali TaxID=129985 RepID=A0ABY9VG46_9BACI|nr:SCO family protein [Mesobacillus jeotgali]UYZ21572.1 SCO family protein [Mesobacillus jeotgali]WNF22578.1 SCO family protein [Mesobacillus jeotgali]
MRKTIGVSIALMVTLILTACGQDIKDPLNWEINDFTFENQNGKKVGMEDLNGEVWVADFIFTSCETVCPPMTANMDILNQKLKKEGINNIKFVSFSVDPDVDTPDRRKDYMERYDINPDKWHFLSGYSQQTIEDFALKNFKTIVKKPENDDQVIHGTSFYLVDKDGVIVKDYPSLSDVPFEQMIEDIKILLNE